MTRRDPNLTYSEDKLRRLEKVTQHLEIALGEFTSITGGAYAGDLREFKELVRVRLKLEAILRRARAGQRWRGQNYSRRSKS